MCVTWNEQPRTMLTINETKLRSNIYTSLLQNEYGNKPPHSLSRSHSYETQNTTTST